MPRRKYNRDLRTPARDDDAGASSLDEDDDDDVGSFPPLPTAAIPTPAVIHRDHEYRPSLVVPGITYAFVAGAEQNNISVVELLYIDLQGQDLIGCASAA